MNNLALMRLQEAKQKFERNKDFGPFASYTIRDAVQAIFDALVLNEDFQVRLDQTARDFQDEEIQNQYHENMERIFSDGCELDPANDGPEVRILRG
jgi:hypothetical protein